MSTFTPSSLTQRYPTQSRVGLSFYCNAATVQFLFLKSHVLDITPVLQGKTRTAIVDLAGPMARQGHHAECCRAHFSALLLKFQGFYLGSLCNIPAQAPPIHSGVGLRHCISGPRGLHST